MTKKAKIIVLDAKMSVNLPFFLTPNRIKTLNEKTRESF